MCIRDRIYATYYTTRKDNAWAKANPDEIQQMYIMSSFHTATSDKLEIHLMDHLYPDMLKVNTRDDITKWWEVIDRRFSHQCPSAPVGIRFHHSHGSVSYTHLDVYKRQWTMSTISFASFATSRRWNAWKSLNSLDGMR